MTTPCEACLGTVAPGESCYACGLEGPAGEGAVMAVPTLTQAHCPSCTCGKRAPVQGEPFEHGKRPRGPGTVTWAEHMEAYSGYSARYGTSQSAQRLAERGGFGYSELTELLGHEPITWLPREQ